MGMEELFSKTSEALRGENQPHILVVDDVPEMLNLLTDILSLHHFRVSPASSGNSALKSVEQETPDLILLDVDLPDMTGYEVCRRLKSDGKAGVIPVMFISGHEETADKVKGFQAGGVDYIKKPFHQEEVLARVQTHLALYGLRKQIERQNIRLQQEILERRQAEDELKEHKAHLEETVSKRTEDLRNINEDLQHEIAERQNVELVLEQTNGKLHSMVYEYGLRHQRIFLFNRMAEKLQSCNSLEETYPVIGRFAEEMFPATAGAMFMFEPSGNRFEMSALWGRALSGEVSFGQDDCLALRKGKMNRGSDGHSDSCCRHLSGVERICSLCIPLLAQGETLGMLHLQHQASQGATADPSEFGDYSEGIDGELQQLALTVGDHLSLFLANMKLRDTLRQQATCDPLTGLFNRRYMEETLSREARRADRSQTSLGIIMIDLDHFRRFNETFGHDAGDLVLKDLGKFLHGHIRAEDVACRYGGEEFTLILPGATLEQTRLRAESLRQAAQKLQMYYNNILLDGITLSLGVAVFPAHGSTGPTVLQAADAALYKAKHEGRNRVIVSGETTSAPGEP
jgi:diguanylate cyclase (GGDEF)-like protein